MIIKKNIIVGLDVLNPINIYTDSKNIKRILKNRLVGKCEYGCYIKKINKVIEDSDCIINQDGSPDFGSTSVVVEVTAIVYGVGEIINGCVVTNKDKNGTIICSTEIASIMLLSNKSLESITKGQIISIRVGSVRYNKGSEKISINAIPFLFTNKPIVYRISNITNDMKLLLTDVLNRISFEESEMKKLKSEKAKAWETFDQLLYAYKTEQTTPPGAKVLSIMDIVNKGIDKSIIYLSRDTRLNLSTPNVYGYDVEKFPEGSIKKYEVPTANVLILILEDYCAYLRTIREMIDIYSTEEVIGSHRNLWQIFKKSKF